MIRRRLPSTLSDGRSLPRRGFTLVLVLGLLMVCVLYAQRIASRSLSAALHAIRAESELQERWASWSIQQTLLANPTDLLTETRQTTARVRPQRSWDVLLSGQAYRVQLADESSKANLNTAHRDGGTAAVEILLRRLQPAGARLSTRLRPFSEAGRSDSRAVFDSWGQVFEQRSARTLDSMWIAATQDITCWGDGRLNLCTAPDAVVEALLAQSLSAPKTDALLKARTEHPAAELGDLFSQAKLTRAERSRLSDRLTDASTTYSVWIQTETSPASSDARLELHIRDTTADSGRVESFTR